MSNIIQQTKESRSKGPCEVDGCPHETRTSVGKYCTTHEKHWRAGKELVAFPLPQKARDKVCEFEECGRPVRCKGYCTGHYNMYINGYDLKPLMSDRPYQTCAFDGCGRNSYYSDYCKAHKDQFRVYGEYTPLFTPKIGCDFPNCEEKHKGHGYCSVHLKQFRSGDKLRPIRKFGYTPGETCIVDGCDDDRIRDGRCQMHFSEYFYGVTAEVLRERNDESRMRKLNLDYEKVTVSELRSAYGDLCFYCKRTMSFDWSGSRNRYATKEHLNPCDSGGGSTRQNLRLACWSCNSSKNKKNFWEFMIYLSDKFEAGKLDWSTGRFRDEPLFEPEDLLVPAD